MKIDDNIYCDWCGEDVSLRSTGPYVAARSRVLLWNGKEHITSETLHFCSVGHGDEYLFGM